MVPQENVDGRRGACDPLGRQSTMRIAVLSEGFYPEVSGVTIAVAQHLAFFAARGHELLLVHPRYPDSVRGLFRASAPPPVAAEVVMFDSTELVRHRPETRAPTGRGADEVARAISRFSPQLVFYHNPDRLVPDLGVPWRPHRVAGLAAARALGAAIVPLVHTLLPLYVERSAQWYWRLPVAAALARRVWCGVYNEHFPERVVTFDVGVRDYLRTIGFAMPILAGPWNGVDPAVFHPRAAPPDPTDHGSPLRLVSIGRLVREKNAHLLPDLVRALRATGVAFELVIVGDGPLGPALRAALVDAPEVTWRGWQDPAAVAAELARADAYISLSDTESFSLTAQEAVATGVPVVVPDVHGFRRLAAMDVGLLFPAAWLGRAGMTELAAALRASRPEFARWARRAAEVAPSLTWTAALTRFTAAIAADSGLEGL